MEKAIDALRRALHDLIISVEMADPVAGAEALGAAKDVCLMAWEDAAETDARIIELESIAHSQGKMLEDIATAGGFELGDSWTAPAAIRRLREQGAGKLRRALQPFAMFSRAMATMGGTYPKDGDFYTIHPEPGLEMTLTVEHFKLAADAWEDSMPKKFTAVELPAMQQQEERTNPVSIRDPLPAQS